MLSIPRRVLYLILALMLVLLGINVWIERSKSLDNSETSLGVGVDGYKAAYDLLHELHFPAGRSYVRPVHVPHDHVLWMVMPDFLNPEARLTDADVNDLKEWIKAGGVAVVMGDVASQWDRLGLDATAKAGETTSLIKGDFATGGLTIPIENLAYFKSAEKDARVRLNSDGRPFALEKKMGGGKLIAIADGQFIFNSNLDKADASVLLVDLVREIGTPDFDEYSHGLVASESAFALFSNPQLLILLAIASITALLWIAQQHSFPARGLRDEQCPAPSLDSFVDSLGVLYSRSNDPIAAFNAYRASFLRRARRQLSPKIELSEQSAIDRLARDRSLSEEDRAWLQGNKSPTNEAELVRAVRALESCPGLTNEHRQ
ncbi:DUF4350 domain-containing protein [Candidatus Binatus sp.]|uniref:DUF4350 domain-containing protein n=1 Tax=Candidatus Binatus sp. TaxID=2811406 RepID=UPI003C5AF80A